MIIRKAAIEEFLKAPRDDWRPWKDLTLEDLERVRGETLPIKPPIWYKLLRHQRICFILGAVVKRFAFHLKVGMGKTLVALALIKYFRKINDVTCVLVLVPNLSNKVEWADEIEKHSPKTKYVVLQGSSRQKWELLEQRQDALIFVETYVGLSRMVCELVPGKNKNHNKLKPSSKLVAQLVDRIDGLILDESTFVASKMALPYRICRQVAKHAKILFTLTGTPFGRDPTLMWSQFHLIDQGASLGPTLGLFRAAFFNATENGWGGTNYKFRPTMAGALHRCIAHRSISMKPNPKDLPYCTRITKEVRLAQDATSYYAKARTLLYEAGDNPYKVQEAFVRMRQISSGFLGYKDDQSKGEIFFTPNAKLDMLIDLLQKFTPGEDKVIIFHDFIPSGDMICRELRELKINHVRIGGRIRDTAEVLHAFKNDPGVMALVLNHAAGGYGLNLQAANVGIVYESPVSVILRQQIEARFIRQYSTWSNVFLYDLVAKNTADSVILKFAAEGKDLYRAIVDGQVKL